MNTCKKLFLVLGGMVLVLGIGWAAWPQQDWPYFKPAISLGAMLPAAPVGWTSEDLPLGETEAMLRVVEEKLRFDQALYRVYRRGGLEVGVYVAYWKPGGMDPWLIALHTPDICWIGNGAKLGAMDDELRLAAPNRQTLWPGRFRVFDWPNGRQEVVFWHLYGGEPSGFPLRKGDYVESRWQELKLTLKNTWMGRVRKEQVFIRISTNRTMDEVVRSDLWPVLMKSLAPTGLLHEGT